MALPRQWRLLQTQLPLGASARSTDSSDLGGTRRNAELNDFEQSGAVPTRVNYKRRSFIARNFFAAGDEGFSSQGGVTHAFGYYTGNRPLGGLPRGYRSSKTSESGYRFGTYHPQWL